MDYRLVIGIGVLIVVLIAILIRSRVSGEFLGNKIATRDSKKINRLEVTGESHTVKQGTSNTGVDIERNSGKISGKGHDIQQGSQNADV
jgi:uncharacterized Zn ribbon protein